jgi:hypothetical protein
VEPATIAMATAAAAVRVLRMVMVVSFRFQVWLVACPNANRSTAPELNRN